MAIRFVDVAPEDEEPAPARRARSPERGALPAPPAEPELPPDGEAPLPGLPHAKPEPKPRGRRKPLPEAGSGQKAPNGPPPAPLLAGLLPEPQAHAKPTPKPRGRKKAFG